MPAFFLKSYSDDLLLEISKELLGVKTCTGQDTDPLDLARQILDKIIEQTTNFDQEEIERLLVNIAYFIHDVLCDNPDESRGWYTSDMELAKIILPHIRDSGLLEEFVR